MLVDAVQWTACCAGPKNRLALVEDDEELEELDEPGSTRATVDEVTRRAMDRVRQAEEALAEPSSRRSRARRRAAASW